MTQEFHVPELGENIETGTVVKVFVTAGDAVARDQPVVELETGKAVVEIPSDVEGTVERVLVKPGDEVKVGQALFTVKEAPGAAAPPAEPAEAPRPAPAPAPPAPAGHPAALPAAPSIRRLAREKAVDLFSITGTGPNGRILESDVLAAAGGRAAPGGAGTSAPTPAAAPPAGEERRPMGPVRRVTARRMIQAWTQAPHVTQFGRADVTELEALKSRLQDEAEREGVTLSLTVLVIRALAGALKAFPAFNATVDMERQEIVCRRDIHIGVAMDTPRGLVAPVIRDAGRRNLRELAGELKALTTRARDGKLAPADLEGGSFTLSNAGALGGDLFTPIVNWPEVAILGVARTRVEPVFREGAFQPRPLLPLALSYDHRVLDGADGVRFMRWLVDAIEDPVRLLWKG